MKGRPMNVRKEDKLHLNYSFAGARMLLGMLGLEGMPVDRL
jgi:hypothetical protein